MQHWRRVVVIDSQEDSADEGGPWEQPTGAAARAGGDMWGGERREAETASEETRLSRRPARTDRLQPTTQVRAESRGGEDDWQAETSRAPV